MSAFTFRRAAGSVVAALAALGLSACSSSGSSSSGQPGNPLANLIFWGSSTVPPAPELPIDDDFECPSIGVAGGGASLRLGGEAVRAQYSIEDAARECTNIQRDGSHTLKVAAEGRVLLGQAGAPGRYDVVLRFTVKAGSRVIASRVQRQAVTVPAGGTQGTFQMVEDGIQVPAGLNNVEIEVGFAQGGAPAGERRRRAAR